MVLAGKVQHGVIVLDRDEMPPDGTVVAVIPAPHLTANGAEKLSSEERRRVQGLISRIAALPVEGLADPFGGADHDRVLYGKP